MHMNRILIVIALAFGIASVLWLVFVALLSEKIPNVLVPQGNYTFDYVVVGAGSAGCVVATLLAQNSNATVLLVEAGDSFGVLSSIPLLATFQQKGVNDWGFLSTPQAHSSMGLESKRQSLPRGKGLGGSSQLNYMLHSEGYEGDFQRWATEYHIRDWSWSFVEPFLKATRAQPHELLTIGKDYSKLAAALHNAKHEFSHKPWRFRDAVYTIKSGLRYNVYQRFLRKAHARKNLKIMPGTWAKKIEFEEREGRVGVKSLLLATRAGGGYKETLCQVTVARDLIMSAGVYQTPQLLMVSGLGNRTALRSELGVTPHKLLPDLPLVGQQLHDHINLPLYISLKAEGPTLNQRALLDLGSLLAYIVAGGGHLGNFGVLGHLDSLGPMLQDMYSVAFFGAGAIDETAFMSISNFKREHFRALFPRYYNATQEGFVLITTCLQPLSRGDVTLRGSKTAKNLAINPNYLARQEDIECTIKAVRAGVEVVTSQSFSSMGPHIHWPRIKECANFGPFTRDFQTNRPSDHYLECIMRHVGLGSHHPAGTCRMGTGVRDSVVDSQFRVHGVQGLRIIDASVLPGPLSGYPNTVIVAMAARGVALILRDLQASSPYQ